MFKFSRIEDSNRPFHLGMQSASQNGCSSVSLLSSIFVRTVTENGEIPRSNDLIVDSKKTCTRFNSPTNKRLVSIKTVLRKFLEN